MRDSAERDIGRFDGLPQSRLGLGCNGDLRLVSNRDSLRWGRETAGGEML